MNGAFVGKSGQKKTDVRRQKSDEGHSQAVRGCVKIRIMDEKSLPVVPSSWEEGLGVVEKNNDITYLNQRFRKVNPS